jgi:hypothetical protein
MRAAALLLILVSAYVITGCDKPLDPATPKPGSTPTEATLPLSPGMQVAWTVSGGIAGLNDSVQVSHDWNLIVVTSDAAFVRRVTGDEQMALREVLKNFGTLWISEGNEPGIPDGMGSIVVARGWGTGVGTAEDAQAVAAVLGEMRAAGPERNTPTE